MAFVAHHYLSIIAHDQRETDAKLWELLQLVGAANHILRVMRHVRMVDVERLLGRRIRGAALHAAIGEHFLKAVWKLDEMVAVFVLQAMGTGNVWQSFA